MLTGESMGDRVLRVDRLELEVPAVDKNLSDQRAESFKPGDVQAEVVECWSLPVLAILIDLSPELAAEIWLDLIDDHGGSEDRGVQHQL